MSTNNTIVVGVDYSPASESALQWALDAALRRKAAVRIVHVPETAKAGFRLLGPTGRRLEKQMRDRSRRLLEEEVDLAKAWHSGIDVSQRLATEADRAELVEESQTAEMVVVGNLGFGGFTGLLVGSTALHLANHAHCPVIVVPATTAADSARHGVVVGIDERENADAVLEFAFNEANLLGEPLTAVHAWHGPTMLSPTPLAPLVYDADLVAGQQRVRVEEALSPWRDKFPDVEVRTAVELDHPAKALVEASSDARLLVVGRRDRGELQSLVLGSVSHAVLHHASAPVAVVNDPS
jgi:nucleotide-binding universal stress UspA family protein